MPNQDYPQTQETIEIAYFDNCLEREALGVPRLPPPSFFVTDRPVDRCLADGGALVNSVCVRCGRDNS